MTESRLVARGTVEEVEVVVFILEALLGILEAEGVWRWHLCG